MVALIQLERNSASTEMKSNLKSFEIVTLAVSLLGGDANVIDTEDIAVKANDLAPGLFTWRKYKNQISFDHVRRQLIDATKDENGAYLFGSVKRGWQLTEKGMAFCEMEISNIEAKTFRTSRIDNKERMRLRLERERMKGSKAYAKFVNDEIAQITQHEADAFFRIDDYVPNHVRENKILRIVNSFATDPELGAAVKEISRIVRRDS